VGCVGHRGDVGHAGLDRPHLQQPPARGPHAAVDDRHSDGRSRAPSDAIEVSLRLLKTFHTVISLIVIIHYLYLICLINCEDSISSNFLLERLCRQTKFFISCTHFVNSFKRTFLTFYLQKS